VALALVANTPLHERATDALRAAASDDAATRHGRFAQFMRTLQELVDTSGDRTSFVVRTAPLIAAAKLEIDRWIDVFARGIYSGEEEEALESLLRRTQLEYARE
jgi:hypothetical protein